MSVYFEPHHGSDILVKYYGMWAYTSYFYFKVYIKNSWNKFAYDMFIINEECVNDSGTAYIFIVVLVVPSFAIIK